MANIPVIAEINTLLDANDVTIAKAALGVLGAVTTSSAATGLNMSTAKILGRTTASTGAVEEITVGSGLSLASGTLTATGTGDVVGTTTSIVNQIPRFGAGTTGKVIKNSLVTVSDTGAITTPQSTASVIPFYYATFASFPAAGTANHGAIAHAHDTGAMYYSHSVSGTPTWVKMLDTTTGGREMPVMTKASWGRYTNQSTGITSMTSRRRVVATVSAKNLKLVFQNSYAETNGNSNITVKASIEDDLGTIYPVYFSGSRTATVLSTGELLTSDAIENLITGKGRTYFLRVNSSWASGNVYLNGVVDNGTQTGEGRSDSVDYTDSGAISTFVGYAYTANMVIGTPLAHNPHETIIFLGDSNMDMVTAQGGYLTYEDNWTVSSLGRDAGRNFSYVRLSASGSKVSTILDAASTRRRRFFPYGSIFIVLLGTNDARAHNVTPTTANAIMANLVTLYKELLAGGAKEVWACTLPPDTSLTKQDGIRVALNNLIRAEPNPLTGVLDLADQLETARDNNTWKTGYASDDLYHLSNTAGAAARDWLRALMFSQR